MERLLAGVEAIGGWRDTLALSALDNGLPELAAVIRCMGWTKRKPMGAKE